MTLKEEVQFEEYKRAFAEAYKQGFMDAMSVFKTEQTVDKDINVRSKEEPYIDIETGILHWCGWKYRRIYEDEPQTDNGIGCSRCEGRFDCYDRDKPHAVHCNNYGKVTDEPQTERSE